MVQDIIRDEHYRALALVKLLGTFLAQGPYDDFSYFPLPPVSASSRPSAVNFLILIIIIILILNCCRLPSPSSLFPFLLILDPAVMIACYVS